VISSLRILFLTQEDYLAGSTYSVFFLARGLSQRGHKVYVAARKDSLLNKLCDEAGLHFFFFEPKSRFDLRAMLQIRSWVSSTDIDIINSQSSKDRYLSVFSRWIFNLPVKVIHTRRQLSLSIGGPLQNLVYVKGTHKIIAVGNGVKESLKKGGVPDHHVKVIYNGTPQNKYQNINRGNVNQLKARFNIKDGDLVIGCISRRKQQEQLLQSLNYLSRPAKVILVGIEQDDQLNSIIKQYTIPHQVYFEGRVPSEMALNYILLFRIYVLCSVTEGLSQSLLEAMYLKVPVIATNASGNNDLIDDGTNGLLFENNDVKQLAEKIEFLDREEAISMTFSELAHRKVLSQFSIEATLFHYENFFYDLKQEESLSGYRPNSWPKYEF